MSDKVNHFSAIDLPPVDTQRWVKSRKIAVVAAIEQGQLSMAQACERYNLSEEELTSWHRMLKTHGPEALRTTHLKRYRTADLRTQNFHIIIPTDGRGV